MKIGDFVKQLGYNTLYQIINIYDGYMDLKLCDVKCDKVYQYLPIANYELEFNPEHLVSKYIVDKLKGQYGS